MFTSCTADQHYFEPRYNETTNPKVADMVRKLCKANIEWGDITLAEIWIQIKDREYICDICRYCGAKV